MTCPARPLKRRWRVSVAARLKFPLHFAGETSIIAERILQPRGKHDETIPYFTPPPLPLANLAPLLLLALLAGPVQAQLVVPATTGAVACTEGGSQELRANQVLTYNSTPTSNSIVLTVARIDRLSLQQLTSTNKDSYALNIAVRKNPSGDLINATDIGTVDGDNPSSDGNYTFSSLEKNTRYVAIIYEDAATPIYRRCFKTRGEFTNAEQNLYFDGFEWQPNLTRYNRTGCYAVASTRQDIRDCYCNGTRNGTHILAGQTVASQAQRQYLNCPDLDS